MLETGAWLIVLWMGSAGPELQAANGPGTAASPPPAMEMTIVGTSLKGSDGKIYVNQNCEVFPGLTFPITGRKLPAGQWNADLCHLESVLQSDHRDEKVVGNELRRSNIEVREQEYVLQNITLEPQVFAVLEQVPQGWAVDSDPKPARMEGEVAIFEVHAGAGETVRLHVGERRTKELKPKALPATTAP